MEKFWVVLRIETAAGSGGSKIISAMPNNCLSWGRNRSVLFFAWMVKDRRSDRNPVEHLAAMNASVEVGRVRRCLSGEELALFLAAAARGKPIRR